MSFLIVKRQLRNEYNLLRSYNKSSNKYNVELHKKFSLPVASILFIMTGASLGVLFRKGGFTIATGLSFGFFLIYYILMIGGEDLADRGLGGRPGTEPGDHSAQDRRGVFEEAGKLFGDVEDPDAAARPTHFICPSIHVVMSVLSSSGRLSDTLVAADADQRVGAHAASAASTSSTTMRRRSASSAT